MRAFDPSAATSSKLGVTPSTRQTITVWTVALVFAFASIMSGCFSTYSVSREQFATLQTTEEIPRTVVDLEGEEVLVERETPVFVRSEGGRRYQVTPYNFRMTSSQLVASDRDTLLALNEVDSYEVDLFDTGLTVLLIALGAAAVGGIIAGVAVTAGDKSLYGN